jgi:hypothetical protein
MLGKIKHIIANGKEYPIAFTLNVMEAIQEKYGSMDAWSKVMDQADGKEIKFKDLIWILKEIINEGIDIENENNPTPRPFLTHKQVGRLISSIGMNEISGIVQNLTIESVKSDDEKNMIATQNQIRE